jgi:hypothetical protein
MCTFQRVINLLEKVNPLIRRYVVCLIVSDGRKNCANMARSVGLSPKPLYRYLANAESTSKETRKMLLQHAKQTRIDKITRALIVDPTNFNKRYAKKIDNLCYDKDGCTKHVEYGLTPVYAAIADKNVKIPLCLDFWVQQKITGKKKYRSKARITIELISSLVKDGLEFDFVSLDGAFAAPDMFSYFKENSLKFIMRIPRNRCITKKDGSRIQLKNCPELKLLRNEREKTIQATLHGDTYFFTAQKRKCKNAGWEVVFLVSNMDLKAKEQVAAFNLRWPVEKINRTTKQKTGSTQCQALSAAKQEAHILAGFLAHTILEVAQNDKEKYSVDVMVNYLKESHFDDLIDLIAKHEKNKPGDRIDLDVKSLQNHIQNSPNNIDQVETLVM